MQQSTGSIQVQSSLHCQVDACLDHPNCLNNKNNASTMCCKSNLVLRNISANTTCRTCSTTVCCTFKTFNRIKISYSIVTSAYIQSSYLHTLFAIIKHLKQDSEEFFSDDGCVFWSQISKREAGTADASAQTTWQHHSTPLNNHTNIFLEDNNIQLEETALTLKTKLSLAGGEGRRPLVSMVMKP